MKVTRIAVVCTVALVCLIAVSAVAQDFQKSYSLAPGSRVAVKNVSGNVVVNGYPGSDVVIAAIKEGPDRELVQIEEQQDAQGITVVARYPQNTRCDASVRFELRVPAGTEYNFDSLSSASGNVSVEGVQGKVRARTASGNVSVRQARGSIDATSASGNVEVQGVSGAVNARTASGDVDVELLAQSPADEMKFATASGNVTVRAPANFDAEVEMSTASGSLKTDFPLKVEDHLWGNGKKASGRLGSGSCRVKLSTASGDVNLLR